VTSPTPATPDDSPRVDFAHPANASVLRFLHISEPELAHTTPREHVDIWTIGTHPDLVEYFWKLPAELPSRCACVINERSFPLLVHPQSRVIFGLAGGTSTLAFRLPEPELTAAFGVPGFGHEYRYPSGPVRAESIGDDWALVRPFDGINVAWCRRAFEHAATLE
jgi:hypothetical protein